MREEELSVRVRSFIEAYIDSVELLRVLLLLHAAPTRVWTRAEITSELRSTDTSIAKRLENLYARKVLVPSTDRDAHQFTPVSGELAETIGELAEQNQLRPYRVIDVIYSRRADALEAFADAFKLKGKSK